MQSGNGGKGCVSFRREKFEPKGGPDGGDGGRGGDVVLKVGGRRTLQHFRFKHRFFAPNGEHGKGAQKTGRDGAPCIIDVPPGTVVKDAQTNEVLADLTEENALWVAASGGRGGRGNRRFSTSTNRAPRYAQPGEPGESKNLKLELKLLADVGLVGLPNAGKSTLIAAMSSARPKIGAYPFTTLTPNLGVVSPPHCEPFVVADIPGLIEGAHEGAGLGIRFLRHIERTSVLVHLLDAAQIPADNPLAPYETVQNELVAYNPKLAQKPVIVCLNKIDLENAPQGATMFEKAFGGPTLRISGATGQGVNELVERLAAILNNPPEQEP
ncbi:MAG: GTPase ObgE [Desulfatibacillaceae bacterium]|nr:GTPase ObgE [Desulfatibacillaceae bacterium]